MPGFRNALSDENISSIAAYLRQTVGQKPWEELQKNVVKIRNQPQIKH
jgi:mono/diheme cytochrome c family protein